MSYWGSRACVLNVCKSSVIESKFNKIEKQPNFCVAWRQSENWVVFKLNYMQRKIKVKNMDKKTNCMSNLMTSRKFMSALAIVTMIGQMISPVAVLAKGATPPTTYTITVTQGANGTITPAGTVSVNAGSDKTFTITPNDGYDVSDVKVDNVSKGALTTYTFSNVKKNHTIKAVFGVDTNFHFVKAVCDSYSDIVGNEHVSNLDATGGNYVYFSAGKIKTVTVAEFNALPAGCNKAAGWSFNFTANGKAKTVTTGIDGTYSVKLSDLKKSTVVYYTNFTSSITSG